MDAPSIFLPGWGLGSNPLEQAFTGTPWKIMDLPGHAPPAAPPATGLENPLTAFIPASFESACQALSGSLPPTCHLGGWSLGAMLALALALIAPQRILSLLLVGATPSFINREGWHLGRPPGELRAFMLKFKKEGNTILPHFVQSFCKGDVSEETAPKLLKEASPLPKAAMGASLAWLFEADLRHAIKSAPIACPVTIIHGENDPLTPLAAARWLSDHIPHSRLHTLPGKTHAPFSPDASSFLKACCS